MTSPSCCYDIFSRVSMHLYHMHVFNKFEATQSQTLLERPKIDVGVITSRRWRDAFFHKTTGAYIVYMFPPNLKQISQKTLPPGPKTATLFVWCFFSHDNMRICQRRVFNKFERTNLSINLYDVMTSWRNGKKGDHHYNRPPRSYI